eukprot:3826572-Pleurochrysis_carterae.AAC.2
MKPKSSIRDQQTLLIATTVHRRWRPSTAARTQRTALEETNGRTRCDTCMTQAQYDEGNGPAGAPRAPAVASHAYPLKWSASCCRQRVTKRGDHAWS